jgi:hypothetical protein
VTARTDCRHYSRRTVTAAEVVERCRLDMATTVPFSCPEDCVFFEPRAITDAGWQQDRRKP